MSRIELTAVSKHWGATRAVDALTLTAEPGQLLALLGPSGCGKSTALRLIAGLEQADAGRVQIGERDVTHLPPAQRGVSMVFQSYALFPHLTVGQNIEFGLRVRRVDAAQRARRLAHVAELLGLAELLHRKPAQLSGGQRQRVALGRAIIAEAPVCLMDEPLSNLDAQLRQQMRTEIRALQQRLGITMVYVTHDQTEAMTMADRVVLMRSGRLEQQGTPAELYEQPATAFAAAFIGAPAMNLFDAARLPEGLRPAAWSDQELAPLQAGVRPEQVDLCAPAAGLPARVDAVEYLGAESMLICSVADTRFLVRRAGLPAARAGDTVGLRWAATDLFLFRKDDGGRVAARPDPALHQP